MFSNRVTRASGQILMGTVMLKTNSSMKAILQNHTTCRFCSSLGARGYRKTERSELFLENDSLDVFNFINEFVPSGNSEVHGAQRGERTRLRKSGSSVWVAASLRPCKCFISRDCLPLPARGGRAGDVLWTRWQPRSCVKRSQGQTCTGF